MTAMEPNDSDLPQGEPPMMPDPEPPTVKRVSTDLAMREIKEALADGLVGFGTANATAAAQMSQFLREIQPDVEQALTDADVMSLGYIRDRIVMRAGRVSLGLIYQQKILVANTVTTVLRILIKVAIGAVAV